MNRTLAIAFVFVFLWIGETVLAETLEQAKSHFEFGKNYQVKEVADMYYILSSSPFKDAQSRRNLAQLSKAALFKYLNNKDQNITGLQIREFRVKYFYEENGRLFAISTLEKINIIRLFDKNNRDEFTESILAEIAKLEATNQKDQTIHEQLKELYFLIGDIDNFDKQTDRLMELKFNDSTF